MPLKRHESISSLFNYGKKLNWLNSLVLVRQPVKEKENSEFYSFILDLKIDLVSHPSRVRGVG